MIEEGWIHHPILFETIHEYVRPFVEKYPPGVALLGCTHYPWIHQAFEKWMPHWKVVNSASAVAESLSQSSLFQQASAAPDLDRKGTIEWIFTDPQAVPAFAQQIVHDLGEG
jgi:glutamate racemase